MPQSAEYERANLRILQRFPMLLFKRAGFDVFRFGVCGPHPTLNGFLLVGPPGFENLANAKRHRQHSARSLDFAVSDEERSESPVVPTHIFQANR